MTDLVVRILPRVGVVVAVVLFSGCLDVDETTTLLGSAHGQGVSWPVDETVPPGSSSGAFGVALDVLGDTVVVASRSQDAGLVHVLNDMDGGLTETQVLSQGAATEGYTFGASVAVDADFMAVGAIAANINDQNGGAVHMYTKDPQGDWIQEQRILYDQLSPDLRDFGAQLDLDSGRLIVSSTRLEGAIDYYPDVRIFVRNGGVWIEEQILDYSVFPSSKHMVLPVALEGDIAVLGAPYEGDSGFGDLLATVFRRDSGVWVQQQNIMLSDLAGTQKLESTDVAIRDGVLAISSFCETGPSSKYAQVSFFDFDGAAFQHRNTNVLSQLSPDTPLRPWISLGDGLFAVGYADWILGEGRYAIVVFDENIPLSADSPLWSNRLQILTDADSGEYFHPGGLAITGHTLLVGGWGVSDESQNPNDLLLFDISCADEDVCDGFCSDGQCCDQECGGNNSYDCWACSVATGAMADGVCTPLHDVPCDDGDPETTGERCNHGVCQSDEDTDTDSDTDHGNWDGDECSGTCSGATMDMCICETVGGAKEKVSTLSVLSAIL